MLEFIDNFKSALQVNISTTDDVIVLRPKDVARLNAMKEGNHIYLTIKYLDRYEIVKYTHDAPIKGCKVPITRDVLSQGRKNFPCTACVVADWNAVQLREFVCQTNCGGK